MKKRLLSIILLSLLVIVAVFSLTSCDGEGGKTEISAPTGIQYDGAIIKWNTVNGAKKYHVKINDLSEISTGGTAYAYQSNTQFTVTITAVGEEGEASTTHTFVPLERIESFDISETGELSWSPINGAAGYIVSVNGTETSVYDTKYSFNEAGTYKVKVKPSAQSVDGATTFYALWSTEKTLTICQNVDAESIRYSAMNAKITWDSVQGAAKYHLVITGGTTEVDEIVTGTSYNFDAGMQNFTIRIKALGNGSSSFDSKDFAERKMVYLEAAKNLRVEDGILYWDAVAGASGYQVKINGVIQHNAVKECQLTNFPVQQTITVSLLPLSDDTVYFSSWSADFSFMILAAPVLQWNNLSLDGQINQNIFWDTVNGAGGYQVKVTYNGTEIDSTVLGQDVRSYGNAYLQAGLYEVRIKSVAPNGSTNFSDSAYSAPIKITRLTAPTFASGNAITSNPDRVADGFTVTFTPVAGATQYKIWKDDTEYAVLDGNMTQYTDANVIDPSIISEQIYSYKIQAIGRDVRQEAGGVQTVYLSSLSSSALSFNITVLKAPDFTRMEGYDITYQTVGGAYGYSVNVSGATYKNESASFNLSSILKGGTSYDISVCSRGNGGTTLSSNYTPAIKVYRLAAPTDLVISTQTGSDGLLTFTTDPNGAATSYDLVIKGYTQPIKINNKTNIREYITTDGTTIHVVAVANNYNSTETLYTMTSEASQTRMFTKLEAPTFGEKPLSNSSFTWNAPGNVTSYTPTYLVANAQTIIQGVELNGTTMSTEKLDPGYYNFKVMAIGDEKLGYINSDYSATVSVTKLKSPEVEIKDNMYQWKSVADAASYAVYVGDKLVFTDNHKDGTTFKYAPDFNEIGIFEVRVYAIGDGGINTLDSSPCTIKQVTDQLTTPKFIWKYVTNFRETTDGYTFAELEKYETDGKILVEISKESKYATGYCFAVGGATSETDKAYFATTPNSQGTITISVYACGGGFDENNVYYIDSQSESIKVHLLTTVGKVYLNSAGIVSFGDGESNPNITQYRVTVNYNGKEYDAFTIGTTKFNLLDVLEVDSLPTTGTLSITVCSLGIKESTIPSEDYTEYFNLQK